MYKIEIYFQEATEIDNGVLKTHLIEFLEKKFPIQEVKDIIVKKLN